MKISTKCRYGLRAMVYLAKHTNEGPVKRKDISREESIPTQYLENILLSLRKMGLITTLRGASGGFVLSKPADSITLSEIVEGLEGPLIATECVLNPEICKKKNGCEANILWTRIYKAIRNILVSMTLSDLVNIRREEWVI